MSWLQRAVQGLARSAPNTLTFEDYVQYFNWQGLSYGARAGSLVSEHEEIGDDFEGLVQGAYKGNGVIFACMVARMLLFAEARFQFRTLRSGRPGDLYGDTALAPLETPWKNGTTGNLLSRMIQDVDLAGNSYIRRPGRTILRPGSLGNASGSQYLQRLRPDWVTIVLGSQTDAEDPADAIDVELAGYLFHPGGKASGKKPHFLFPEEVAHFAPIPDPIAVYRGMSWITPIIREVMGDGAATAHKLKFFENGATPNMVVTAQPDIKTGGPFDLWVQNMKQSLKGLRGAYETLYLGYGSTAEVVGKDMKEVDFRATQGAGETRIAAAAGVPPIIVGLSEGLASATYSNYGQARRRFADGTMRPLWRDAAASLSTLIDLPRPIAGEKTELWYDDRDIPFLQEDVKDAAEAQQVDAISIKQLIDSGYTPESVVDAVTAGDLKRLKHSGLVSVQLQPPGVAAAEDDDGAESSEDDAPATPAQDPPEPAPAAEGENATGRLVRALQNP